MSSCEVEQVMILNYNNNNEQIYNSFNVTTASSSGNDTVFNSSELSRISQSVLIIIYSCTTFFSIFGNVVVIVVFSVGRNSKSDLRAFLINLAISDVIMASFCMPFTFTMPMLGNWIFSEPMCPIVLYMQTLSVTASVCTITCIGIDRYLVVTFPLRSRVTKYRSKLLIFCIWMFACAVSSVQLIVGRSTKYEVAPGLVIRDCNEIWPEPSKVWRRSYTFFLLITTYILPLTILSITYGFISRRLWTRAPPGNADHARDVIQMKSKRKVIKMLVVVVTLFAICWLPLHLFILVIDFNHSVTEYDTLEDQRLFIGFFYFVHWLAMANSFVNPVVYGFLNDSFRLDLKILLRRVLPSCCRSKFRLHSSVTTRKHSFTNDSAYLSHSIVRSYNDQRPPILMLKHQPSRRCAEDITTSRSSRLYH